MAAPNTSGQPASNSSTLSIYKTVYSRGSALGKRRPIIPDDQRFRFRAYGFPKIPIDASKEKDGQMPTQSDINQLVEDCIGVPITSDHGKWEIVIYKTGRRERFCKRAPNAIGKVVSAFIDEKGRLVLDCELEPSLYGMSQAQMISSGAKRDVSLGLLTNVCPKTGKTNFTLDHVALVPQGRAKGTHIFQASCPAMPNLEFSERHHGIDAARNPLTARLHQMADGEYLRTKTQVAETQKSPLDTGTKTTNDVSLYSSCATQLSIVSTLQQLPQLQSLQVQSSDAQTHCPSPPPTVNSTTSTHNSSSVATPSIPSVTPIRMSSSSTASPVPTGTTAATPAVPAATNAPTDVATNAAAALNAANNAPLATSNPSMPASAPITANELASAIQQSVGETVVDPNLGQEQPDVSQYFNKLLQDTETPAEDKFIQVSEKLLEQSKASLQLQQEMKELKQRLSQYENDHDAKSRQKVESQVQLLEQAMQNDPNNPAFAEHGLTKEFLAKFRDVALKMQPEDRDVMLKYNEGIAAFGINAQVQETFEIGNQQQHMDSAMPSNSEQSYQDELARLRAREAETQAKMVAMQRQQRQAELARQFANLKSVPFTTRSMPPTSSPSTSTASSSSSSSSPRGLSQFPIAARQAAVAAGGSGAGSVSNFGINDSVFSRMSEETLAKAIAPQAKRAPDTSADDAEHQPKRTTAMAMGNYEAQKADLARKVKAYETQKKELALKAKRASRY
jgi:hypothetical protein